MADSNSHTTSNPQTPPQPNDPSSSPSVTASPTTQPTTTNKSNRTPPIPSATTATTTAPATPTTTFNSSNPTPSTQTSQQLPFQPQQQYQPQPYYPFPPSASTPIYSDPSPAARNVYVGGLPPHWRDFELGQCFSAYGEVELTKILQDQNKQSRGAGFVHFVRHEAALSAIHNLNGFVPPDAPIDPQSGQPRALQVKFAHERGKVNEQQHGHETKQQDRGSKENGMRNGALSSTSSSSGRSNNSGIRYDSDGPISNVYVAGLPRHFTTPMVEALFTSYGKIREVKILTDQMTDESRGIAFIKFDRRADAQQAISEMDGYTIEGTDTQIQVRWAKERHPHPQSHGMRQHQPRYDSSGMNNYYPSFPNLYAPNPSSLMMSGYGGGGPPAYPMMGMQPSEMYSVYGAPPGAFIPGQPGGYYDGPAQGYQPMPQPYPTMGFPPQQQPQPNLAPANQPISGYMPTPGFIPFDPQSTPQPQTGFFYPPVIQPIPPPTPTAPVTIPVLAVPTLVGPPTVSNQPVQIPPRISTQPQPTAPPATNQ